MIGESLQRTAAGARLPRMKACDSSGASFCWRRRPKQREVYSPEHCSVKSSKFPAYAVTRQGPKRLLGSAQMTATTALDATLRSLLSEMRCLLELA
jgi:hypothetical protein